MIDTPPAGTEEAMKDALADALNALMAGQNDVILTPLGRRVGHYHFRADLAAGLFLREVRCTVTIRIWRGGGLPELRDADGDWVPICALSVAQAIHSQ